MEEPQPYFLPFRRPSAAAAAAGAKPGIPRSAKERGQGSIKAAAVLRVVCGWGGPVGRDRSLRDSARCHAQSISLSLS